ncbi:sensor histidine kinase [Paenibacillus ginsengarvi]|uniref:histidine kinase n=1 Tax=Paenibacillus ginsengarvi TaxID=400777 RepID=A0A3B0CE59_9BACL|nr:HAMP domain-containing sensor histidine kinase [Paenibacillus ginsengarvi]RKN84375.1 sensor histidine kinase [Paenibacillus ginsengarvi]
MSARLGIRQWMIIGMLIILIVPRAAFEGVELLDRYVFSRFIHERQQADLKTAIGIVSGADTSRWADPGWQASLQSFAEPAHIGIALLDRSGQDVWHTTSAGQKENAIRQLDVFEQGELRGQALFYAAQRGSSFAAVSAVIVAIMAILFIGWQMGRFVVKPLEAMSVAARRIAGGDLDFHLPDSSVREVATVRSAFHVMGSGLRESLTRQSELEEERRFMIGSIAHDLRTPLFALRGYLSRLEQGRANGNPEKTARYLSVCCQKADLLERLISDLFAYAKLESMEQSLRPEPVEAGRLFAELADQYRPVAKEKVIELRYEENIHAAEVTFAGDTHLLHRALGNLLDNAVRHTPPGGHIDLGWRAYGDRLEFIIEDSGPGIPEAEQQLVFEPFYRGEPSRHAAYGGAGLGLAIARRIMRAHHGELSVRNRDSSGGAVFAGWIPL